MTEPPNEATPNEAMPNEAPPEPAKKAKSKVNWWHEIRGLALMLLGVLAFHTLVAKPFYIPSASMMPNLLVGDRLVVSKYPYGWSWVSLSFHLLPRGHWRINPHTPEYGDIVVPVPPDKNEDYIKRVVALPGDRIKVVNGQIVLNGKPVPQAVEPPVRIPIDANTPCEAVDYPAARVRLANGKWVCELEAFRETLPNGASYTIIDHTTQPLDNTREWVVPPGYVFLMGDNRDHSADSRADAGPYGNGLGGPVPIANIGGRAEFLTFSFDGKESWNPLTWWGALRPGRAWHTLRPPRVRTADGH